MDTELRQLRRVRWAVRGTLALGISASLAANVLHAHHLLIDQIIAGWPPVAVFATIEAIARVPIRRRWLAIIRMGGLGFVAGIAFWVSYWHMASVAAIHGENGSKYLLPLSVDGLVLVSSISLVELTSQIAAAEAAARAATATTVTATTVAAATADASIGAPIVAPATAQAVALTRASAVPGGDLARREPDDEAAIPVAGAAVAATGHDGDDGAGVRQAPNPDAARVAGDRRDRVPEPQPLPGSRGIDGPGEDAARDDVNADDADDVDDAERLRAGPPSAATQPAPATSTAAAGADDLPPATTAEAVAWWRARHPDMPVREICAKVRRSERTVRRILDTLPPVGQHADGNPADTDGHRHGVNGATVTTLADPITSR